MTYDPECERIAKLFLADTEFVSAAHVAELSQLIQTTIEDFIECQAKPKVDVFLRRECIFQYCPNPEQCQQGCINKTDLA